MSQEKTPGKTPRGVFTVYSFCGVFHQENPSNFHLHHLRNLSRGFFPVTLLTIHNVHRKRYFKIPTSLKYLHIFLFFFYQINRYLKKLVASNHKSRASLSPNWCHFCPPRKNVLIFPRKFALEAGKTLERSKNQSSRSGVMSLLKNQDWPKI